MTFDLKSGLMRRGRLLICLVVTLLCQSVSVARLLVANHEDRSTVRYPVVLLRGTLPAKNTGLQVSVGEKTFSICRQAGQFKVLVELTAGENLIRLQAENPDADLQLNISYVPQTNPYYVRVIWMTDSSGDTRYAAPGAEDPQDYESRLRTAAILMQTLTAERMHDLGRPRRTFRLERDAAGQVIVHTLKAPESTEDYYGMDDQRWWRETAQWLNKDHPDPFAKNIVLAAFTRKDARTGEMKAHTALGGGNLGLFGSASLFSWPAGLHQVVPTFENDSNYETTNVHNDSVGRNTIWGLASTTIGATLHEMGHTFDLPHCNDPMGIMTRGFDHFNRVFTFQDPVSGRNREPLSFSQQQEAYFAPISASYLQLSRWFQPDVVEYPDRRPSEISYTKESGEIVVEAESGVAWVGFWVDSNVYAFLEFSGDERKTSMTFSQDQTSMLLDGKKLSTVTTISADGVSARLAIP